MNLPRSNNSIEGWHNAFVKRVAIVHPSVTKLGEKTRREQSKFEMNIAQIRQGQEPKPKKVQYQKLDERIKRLVDDYFNVELGEYLNGLAALQFFCSFFVYFSLHLFLFYGIYFVLKKIPLSVFLIFSHTMKTACYLSLIILYYRRSLSNILTVYATNCPVTL